MWRHSQGLPCPVLPCSAPEDRSRGLDSISFLLSPTFYGLGLKRARKRKKSRQGEKCVVSWSGGQPRLSEAPLSLLGRQVCSFEVRSQSWRNLNPQVVGVGWLSGHRSSPRLVLPGRRINEWMVIYWAG